MITTINIRVFVALIFLITLFHSEYCAFAQSPTTWNESAAIQKAIHDAQEDTLKNLAEENTPSLKIPAPAQSSISDDTEPSWLSVDYAKIAQYEQQITNMQDDQQRDMKKILGLMRIGKVPSQSLSWVQGTSKPPQFILRDWDITNTEFSNGLIVIQNGRKPAKEHALLESESTIIFIKFHVGNLTMNNPSCLMDMTKAVVAKPTSNSESQKITEQTLYRHKQKWPFHYGSFFIFDDEFEKNDVKYYEGSQRIVIDKKRANKKRIEARPPHLQGMHGMDAMFDFPGLIEFKGELCRNLAFASDFRE